MSRFEATYIPYAATGAFSQLVLDYLGSNSSLRSFYAHAADLNGIKDAINSRNKYPVDRELLHSELSAQYAAVNTTQKVKDNIESLKQKNTYTVCTAHQPNIFTGQLYFIYKILHAIRLSDFLNQQIPECHFVPVYYMGSEDADIKELGSFSVNGKKYSWNPGLKGAVGRMKVDEQFLSLLDELSAQLNAESFGDELIGLLKASYVPGISIEQATFRLVNALFAEYGLVVFLPDNAAYKKLLVDVNKKEIEQQFSNELVSKTIARFPSQYSIQAGGRPINLFYLQDNLRERIEAFGEKFKVVNTNIVFSREDLLNEISVHPERFSPNVILRPLCQEMVLPDVAFIGGGSELAYWLELKSLFDAYAVPYPVLLLRNSFMILEQRITGYVTKLSLTDEDLFRSLNDLQHELVLKKSRQILSLEKEKSDLESYYHGISARAVAVDSTLTKHVEALRQQAVNKLDKLEKKMLKAEKKKFDVQLSQTEKIKSTLFPENQLQERKDNFLPYYARWGSAFIRALYQYSEPTAQRFCVLKNH